MIKCNIKKPKKKHFNFNITDNKVHGIVTILSLIIILVLILKNLPSLACWRCCSAAISWDVGMMKTSSSLIHSSRSTTASSINRNNYDNNNNNDINNNN